MEISGKIPFGQTDYIPPVSCAPVSKPRLSREAVQTNRRKRASRGMSRYITLVHLHFFAPYHNKSSTAVVE